VKQRINAVTSKNWKVIVEAKIDKAKAHITDMERALTKLTKQKSTPKIEAEKKTLETAIAKAREALSKLQKQKTAPQIKVDDRATGEARRIRDDLVRTFRDPITQVVNVKTQKGGDQASGGSYVLGGPTPFLAGEAGPEVAAFFPLGSPSRVAAIFDQLTSQLSGILPRAGVAGQPAAAQAGPTLVSVFLDSEPIAARVEVRQQQAARRRARTQGVAW
jgi:hypothetical protein